MIRPRINFPCDVLILEQLLPIQSKNNNHQTLLKSHLPNLISTGKTPLVWDLLVKSSKALGCVQMLL